ncbi:maleylpyruvate isomerase family mycothiol-dependent enzyme [Sphaerisporangium sp. NPDC088356]|uniref:maleylpyruvate isomerase family mycothiol-dependent enzyme n=1 Tax=Sphaerisporangium sp. NPDC088356 TaxID=3154871 RepID=UPI0034417A41
MTVLDDLQAELTAATNRLLATTATLSDADVTAPSLLAGWARGHVLTHVARNADGHINLLTWAKTGVYTPQYPTRDAREAEIAEGAGRPIAEQHADLVDSAARLDAVIDTMTPGAWSATVRGMRPPDHPAWYVLVRRIREVEIHHVDLGAGYTWADWPEAFVRRELHDAMAGWPYAESTVSELHAGGRSWTGLGEGPVVEGPAPVVLAWLTGRLPDGGSGDAGGVAGAGLRLAEKPPAAPPWLTMPAPPGLPATPPEEYP